MTVEVNLPPASAREGLVRSLLFAATRPFRRINGNGARARYPPLMPRCRRIAKYRVARSPARQPFCGNTLGVASTTCHLNDSLRTTGSTGHTRTSTVCGQSATKLPKVESRTRRCCRWTESVVGRLPNAVGALCMMRGDPPVRGALSADREDLGGLPGPVASQCRHTPRDRTAKGATLVRQESTGLRGGDHDPPFETDDGRGRFIAR